MKLAIITAGAVGAFYGSRFAQHGAEVRFVARGEHLRQLQTNGITIKTNNADIHIPNNLYSATADSAAAVRGVDLVLLAVKSYDTPAIVQAMLPGLGQNTVVVSLQNGIDNEEILTELVGAERAAGGVAYILAHLDGPGTVWCPLNFGRLTVSSTTLAGVALPHLQEFEELCAAAEIPCEVTNDIAKSKWTKLIFNSALNGWTAYHATTVDKILATQEGYDAFKATLAETAAVAQASGVAVDSDIVEKTLGVAQTLGAGGSSMLADLQQGRRLEVDALNGTVVRRGEKLGIPTPYNAEIYKKLSALNESR